MTADGAIRDEIRLELVDIDILFLETVARLRAHSLAHTLVSEQAIGVVDLSVERVQSCLFHSCTENLVVEMDSKLSEAVSLVVACRLLRQLLGFVGESVCSSRPVDLTRWRPVGFACCTARLTHAYYL